MGAVVETSDIDYASLVEENLPPGTYCIAVVTQTPVEIEHLDAVEQALYQAGVVVHSVVATDTGLEIVYEKLPNAGIGQGFVAVIPLITTALIVGVITVAIFNLQSITKTTLVVGAIMILAIIFLRAPLPGAESIGRAVKQARR